MENMNINLTLTVAQLNTILKYLGNGVFAEVESAIAAIREQAIPQLQVQAPPEAQSEQTVQ